MTAVAAPPKHAASSAAPLADALVGDGVLVLHDVRIPQLDSTIDHVAVSTSGVYVIDAKRYHGTPQHLVQGGFLSPGSATLLVGRRDCSRLLHSVREQVGFIEAALAADPNWAEVPVHGVLCFIDEEWRPLSGAVSIDGVDVLWPQKVADRVRTPGRVTAYTVTAVHHFFRTALLAA